MVLGADGVIIDERGRPLLLLRRDIPLWVIPGGVVEAGELPTTAVVREVEEETGLKTMAVRLVGLYHVLPNEHLVFVFRCLIRGGTVTLSPEAQQIDYYDTRRLPTPLSPIHRERLARAVTHSGGRPYWGRQRSPFSLRLYRKLLFGWRRLRGRLQGRPLDRRPFPGTVEVAVIINDPAGRALWLPDEDGNGWQLPVKKLVAGESPWDTALRAAQQETGFRVELTGISGVYTKGDADQTTFCFTASTAEQTADPFPGDNDRFFTPGKEPAHSRPQHRQYVGDAARSGDAPTTFRAF